MVDKKTWLKKCIATISCFALTVTAGVIALTKTEPITASAATYRTGTNPVSSSYKNGRYYEHFQSITLTGDGVTDTLALALSQLGYQEGDSEGQYSGEVGGGNNYTEFYYNFGQVTPTLSAEWCAAFCSWALYQSHVTDQGSYSDWCRDHMGNSKYIWKEVSCYYWSEQLMDLGYYGYRGSYTPQSGDLIFFNRSGDIGHIGLVVWCDGSTVYTIEGNTSSGTGIEANGGGAYYKSYALSNTGIHGYGRLPYTSNDNVTRVDYSGKNRTEGQYITNASLSVSSTAGGSTSFTIPQYRMFKVTGFSGTYAKVEYDGSVGYATLNKNTLQISATNTAGIQVKASASKSTFFAGGTNVPTDYREQPNVLVTGLTEELNHYYELEDYGNNKDLVLINGRSWRKWENRPGEKIGKIWVRGVDDSSCYLGFDFNGTSKLKLPSQNGVGEVLQTIVLKRGFQFVNTTSSQWDKDGVIYEGSSVVSKVVGVLQDNIILKAKSQGGFEVIVGGTETVEEQGENQYGIVTGDVVNVRGGPSTDYEIYGTVEKDAKLTYLGTETDGWYNVSYDGKNAWISGTYFTVKGYETITVQKPMSIDGYKIEMAQDVLTTGNIYIAKKPAPVDNEATDSWTVAKAGETYKYLGEMSSRWYKVDYNGNVGWISNTYSTLTAEYIDIVPLNAGWTEDVTPRDYDIITVWVYSGASSKNQVTFLFSDAEKPTKTTVHLGYTDWAGPDEDTTAFMQYIKVNGVPVLTAFPDATLEGLDQRAGLSLKNIALNVDDVVSIEKDAVFEHEGVSMTMQYMFMLIWDGESFVASKTEVVPPLEEDSAISSEESSQEDSSISSEASSAENSVSSFEESSQEDSFISSEESSEENSASSSEESSEENSTSSSEASSEENSTKSSEASSEENSTSSSENSSEETISNDSEDSSSSADKIVARCTSSFGSGVTLLCVAGLGLIAVLKKKQE